MLSYVKQIVDPDSNIEIYEIKFKGSVSRFVLDEPEKYKNFINTIDFMIAEMEKGIVASESSIASNKITYGKDASYLETVVSSYISRKLARKVQLLETLRNHMVGLITGVYQEGNPFDEDYTDKTTLGQKLRIKLGLKPSSIEELEYLRTIIVRERKKLEKMKKELHLPYPMTEDDIELGKPLKVNRSLIEYLENARLAEAERDVHDCEQILAINTRLFNEETQKHHASYMELLSASYASGCLTSDSTEEEIKACEERLWVASRPAYYNEASANYNKAHYYWEAANDILAKHRRERGSFKATYQLVRDVNEYNSTITAIKHGEIYVDALLDRGTSYVRKFR